MESGLFITLMQVLHTTMPKAVIKFSPVTILISFSTSPIQFYEIQYTLRIIAFVK